MKEGNEFGEKSKSDENRSLSGENNQEEDHEIDLDQFFTNIKDLETGDNR